MTPTNYEMVKEFHKAFNLPYPDTITTEPEESVLKLRLALIEEEFKEIFEELYGYRIGEDDNINVQGVAKEIADLLYVTYGFAATLGIPINQVFEEVHKSNMTKLGDDGKPVYRDDGKVLKSKNYRSPNLDAVLGLDK